MKQVVVLSGKGGTGKTSLVASLASLAAESGQRVVCADCDVDASNLGLLMPGEEVRSEPFVAGRKARFQAGACGDCRVCVDACRFDAIRADESGIRVDPLACEGCGVCAVVCPFDAFVFEEQQVGTWSLRRTKVGPLVNARLGVGQDNSGKLVDRVREVAQQEARRSEAELILIDGPPGLGCPVHAALTGCDLAVVVTEPTPSGQHDLVRILELARGFRIPVAVVINKADLSSSATEVIVNLADFAGAPVVAQLPFDPAVPRALAEGRLPLVVPAVERGIRGAWNAVGRLLRAEAPGVMAALDPSRAPR
jgi:MinD superfamily P-loop ATPase